MFKKYHILCPSFESRIFLLDCYSSTEELMHCPLHPSYSSSAEILGLEIDKISSKLFCIEIRNAENCGDNLAQQRHSG